MTEAHARAAYGYGSVPATVFPDESANRSAFPEREEESFLSEVPDEMDEDAAVLPVLASGESFHHPRFDGSRASGSQLHVQQRPGNADEIQVEKVEVESGSGAGLLAAALSALGGA